MSQNAHDSAHENAAHARVLRVALLGNPNTGKTTLFNRLCGLRHKTGNFPGTTQEARVGTIANTGARIDLTDLPGIYSLELEQAEADVCRRVLAGSLAQRGMPAGEPDVACVVIDATNIERNLLLVGEVLRRRLPTIVALNMIDLARHSGIAPDPEALAQQLGCAVIACSGRSGEGLGELVAHLPRAGVPTQTPPGTQEGLETWAGERVALAMAATHRQRADVSPPASLLAKRHATDRADSILTHPVLGLGAFALIMGALFYTIFALAQIPMALIEAIFGFLAGTVRDHLPAGILSAFLADGVLAGLGGVAVFLPQIVLLFFLLSLLEDTGYLARAAFLVDRLMRPFGLSGYAFVPLLSSHACAIPGIIAARTIPDRKERLAAILVAPFMSCSARIPVYVLLSTILFPHSPLRQACAFVGCYALGACAGLLSALVARRTFLKGRGRAMALELPTYKLPSLRTACLCAWDRGLLFLKNAGTNILAISIVLWWLSAYPTGKTPAESIRLREDAVLVESGQLAGPTDAQGRSELAATLRAQADNVERRSALRGSFAGMLGRAAQPVFAPLGYDWQLTVGVLTSFAAREVFASTMAIVTTGSDDAESEGVVQGIAGSLRDDGVTPVFSRRASWSLLVYFVLAMQCLPTLAVTAKEAGPRWAVLQLGWMSLVAYAAALVAYLVSS